MIMTNRAELEAIQVDQKIRVLMPVKDQGFLETQGCLKKVVADLYITC